MANTSAAVIGKGKILSFRPELASVIGLNEAIFLHRLEQLLATELCIHENERKWVCKTIENWHHEEFSFWSKSTIKRTIRALIRRDLVLAIKAEGKNSFDCTKAYSIDYDHLNEFYRRTAYRFITPEPCIIS